MSDLTDAELDDEWSIEEQRHWDWPGRRMIIELRRHRAAVAADEQRVRGVVADALNVELALARRLDDDFVRSVAVRAAKQLATAAVMMTADERAVLLEWRKSHLPWAMPRDDAERKYNTLVAVIDRLLATGAR